MRILASLFILVLLGSCSVQAKLTLSDGPVQVDSTFVVPAATRAAWASLRELDPSLPADPLDAALLQQALGPHSRVAASGSGTALSFSVADPKKFFPGLKTDDGWSVVLDRAAVRRLAALTSWAGSPAVDSLLPSPGTVISEADYRDLLVYLLGPGTPEPAAKVLIDGSTVEVTIVAPRPVKSAPGSTLVSGNTAVYRWPLVRFLTLEKPLELNLKF